MSEWAGSPRKATAFGERGMALQWDSGELMR